MPIFRKRTLSSHNGRAVPMNGFYVHSNPPRVFQMNSAQVRHWLRYGDFERLDQIILDGHGYKLLNEYSSDNKVRTYLKSVPIFMTKIELAHDAVSSNSLPELQTLLQEDGGKRKLASCKDLAGVGLLHKAVYFDLSEIVHYLVDNYPYLVHMKDREGRTACHYAAACKDPYGMLRVLVNAGADATATDGKNRSSEYYIQHPGVIELPTVPKTLAILDQFRNVRGLDNEVLVGEKHIKVEVLVADKVPVADILTKNINYRKK